MERKQQKVVKTATKTTRRYFEEAQTLCGLANFIAQLDSHVYMDEEGDCDCEKRWLKLLNRIVDERIASALEASEPIVDAYFKKPVGNEIQSVRQELPDITSATYEEQVYMFRTLVARGKHTTQESNFIKAHRKRELKFTEQEEEVPDSTQGTACELANFHNRIPR
jgi:predicted transcriptional regulator